MLRFALATLLLAAFMLAHPSARAAELNFDDLPEGSFGTIPTSYKGFSFDGQWYTLSNNNDTRDYANNAPTPSAPNAAIGGDGSVIVSESPFDLQGCLLRQFLQRGALNPFLGATNVTISGYRDGALVERYNFTLAATYTFVSTPMTQVDTVEITASGAQYENFFMIDQITYTLPPAPEIDVQQPVNASIPSGGSKSFVTAGVGYPSELTFTIANKGDLPLELTGSSPVVVSGPDASSFSIVTPPDTTVAPGAATTFVVRFEPASIGVKSAVLMIESNDDNEGFYVIAVSGRGIEQGLGDPDLSFGSGGANVTPISPTHEAWYAVDVQADGKIVTAGRRNGPDRFAVGRYSSTGVLDSTFGSGGLVYTTVGNGSGDLARAVKVLSDGKILVGGYASTANAYDFALARYTSAGVLDTTFGTGGKVTTDISSGSYDQVFGMAVGSDGKIVLVGASIISGTFDTSIARYLSDGTLDTTFGTGGKVVLPMGLVTSHDQARTVAVLPDGKVLVAGYAEFTGNGDDFVLMRLTSTGQLDSTFGTAGVTTLHFGVGHDRAESMVVQPDGRIILAGLTAQANWDFGLARFLSNGALDTSFGTGGMVSTDFAGNHDYGHGLALQADGKIVMVGGATNGTAYDQAVVRYLSSGALDTSFGTGGKKTNATGAGNDEGIAATVASNGGIIVAGVADNSTNTDPDFSLVRYLGTLPVPDIALEQPVGSAVVDGATVSFGSVPTGSSSPLTFTITNPGTADLTSLAITKDGASAAEFTVSSLSATSLSTGSGTVTFTVTFTPTTAGAKTAAIHIGSNVAGAKNPYDITLTGDGIVLVPTIAAVSPASGITSGGTVVTITGANLTGASSVTFGGTAAASFTIDSATQITATTPAHAAGAVSVQVVTPDGTTVANSLYTYAEIPVNISSGTLTLDGSALSSPAETTMALVDIGGGVFVLEITDPTRSLGAPAGGSQVNSNTVRIPVGSVGNVVITGSPFGDTFTLDLSLFTLPGTITVNGGGPSTSPGDSLRVVGAYDDITYGPNGIGSGTIDVDGTALAFTGLEPVDFSAATIGDLTVVVDPTSAVAGDVITTIAAVDAGVNTEITFADATGIPNGLESIKFGALMGTLTIEGDNTNNDFFSLQGLGSAMAGHVSIDGKGGNADVIQVYNATFAVTGTDKNLSLKADFIGVTQTQSADTTPDDPGILRATGNITLEADGDDTLTSPFLWGPSGVWGETLPSYYNAAGAFATRGNLFIMGHIEKTAGSDATLTLRANRNVFVLLAGATGNTAGRIISTNNKLHTIINSDRDALNGGAVSITTYAQVLTNGGDITIGGGANPATTAAKGLIGGAIGVAIQGATVDSSGGAISIRGTGADASGGLGVNISSSSLKNNGLISSGAGNILIVGVGGNFASSGPHGIRIAGDTSSALGAPLPGFATVESTTGSITVNGTSVQSAPNGVLLFTNSRVSSTGGGPVRITAVSAGTTALSISPGTTAGPPAQTGTAEINSTNGQVIIAADTMNLAGGAGTESITAGTGAVTLKSSSFARDILLGSGVTDSALALAIDSSTELPNITADTVMIGDTTNTNILAVSSVISPTTFTTLGLASAGPVTFSATSGFTADVTSATNYEKITAFGGVSITAGATFTANAVGGYVWDGETPFTFLSNDGTDAFIGTFTGPTLTNFLGSTLTATQSYTRGTGNDFVIGAAAPIVTNIFPPDGSPAGGTNVNLTGSHLLGTTSVVIGGLPATNLVVVNSGSVTCDTPAHAVGAVDVTITTVAGTFTVNSGFTYSGPIITASTANLASTATTLTITGTGFSTTPGNNTVAFSPSGTGTVTASTATTLTVTSITGLTPGALFAVATVNGVASVSAQVATVVAASSGPAPINSALGDVVTNAFAPSATGTNDGTQFDILGRGGYLAANGTLGVPGSLKIGVGGVTEVPNNFQAYWKDDGSGLKRLVRSGDAAPGTGGALFNAIPTIPVPGLNPQGVVTLLSALRIGTGSPAVTSADDSAMWSEVGGNGLQLLMRENDPVPGISGGLVSSFGFGCYATATTGATTGEAVFAIKMKGTSTDSVLLRQSITGPGAASVSIVAREKTAAPGAGGELFGPLHSTLGAATRMDTTGNIVFEGQIRPSGKYGIWYQPVVGSLSKVFIAGEAAPGTSSATFSTFEMPSMGSSGTFAFVGYLNADGDNTANDKNNGVWRGTAAGGLSPILRRGDAALPGMVVGSKVGHLWTGWLNQNNRGAWRGWIDTAGDGVSAFPADTYGIYTDAGGTMRLLLKVNDLAPGTGGATLASVDHPVVSGATAGNEHVAFLGTLSGAGVSAGTNDKAIWRSDNGGAPVLLLRTGDSMTTTQGTKTVDDIDLPGSNMDMRPWELPVMDNNGRVLMIITYTDGTTAQVIAP